MPPAKPDRANLLRELDGSLERVVSKVSPAVVQILVSGYGPVDTHGRTDAARIVRQHAIGSGVIVDPNGRDYQCTRGRGGTTRSCCHIAWKVQLAARTTIGSFRADIGGKYPGQT
jgi:hypothetical protein